MKILYNKITSSFVRYPRNDNEDVVDLDTETYDVYTVIRLDKPDYDSNTETIEQSQIVDHTTKILTYVWNVVPLPAVDVVAAPAAWPNVQQFMTAFTMPEKAAISLSTDSTIAALRLELSSWLSAVYLSDERVQTGLNKLEELGIISQARRAEIEATSS